MKILQVMPDFELAGAQTMCENLTMKLVKDKSNIVEVVSFYDFHSEITRRLEENNIKVYYLDKRKGLDLNLFFKLKKVIDKFQPDVIHTHRYALEYIIPTLKFCKNDDIKVIHTVHNVADKEVPKRLQRLQKKWFHQKKVVPVAISEIVQQSIIENYNLPKEDVPIIYNGIDLSKCIKKEDYNLNNIMLHIGRFSEQKNHFRLIDMFNECLKQNKDIKLYLVGTGEKQNDVKQYVQKLNLDKKVEFLGALSECYEIMNKADIFVLPSKWEGMPMTIIEAMGTGLPVIATNVGGIPNMINNGKDGYIANSIEEFVNCINTLYDNKNLRKKIGENALESSKKFSSNIMAEKYIELYYRN